MSANLPSNDIDISSKYVWKDQWDTGRAIKAAWVMIQGCMMITYSIIGWKNYNLYQKGWSWTKTLFVFQDLIIAYLIVWTLTPQIIKGFFIIICCASYQMFFTFMLVIDACWNPEDANHRWEGMHLIFNVFRGMVHLMFWALMLSTFIMPECDQQIYPWNFLALSALILTIQLFALFLWRHNYTLNYETMPKADWGRLYFNEELTRQQLRVLQITNFVFGVVTVGTTAMGAFVTSVSAKDETSTWIYCADWNEWGQGSIWGGLFIGLHQMLILLQINASQYVLIRLPRSMKVFDQDSFLKQFAFQTKDEKNIQKIYTANEKKGQINDPLLKHYTITDAIHQIRLAQEEKKRRESQSDHDSTPSQSQKDQGGDTEGRLN